MSRHAPTLFVGLGGSGIQVLRWVKTRILDGRPISALDDEPVVFLGIDFDPMANAHTTDVVPLAESEFRYFDPAPIASCVNNIDRERQTVASSDKPSSADERWEFPEIREWYPDPEQKVVRYAQSETTGAAQWRPLGRIGFFLYDREINEALASGLTDLDRKRGKSVYGGEQPMVILVASTSGGTGSSILFDVAVATRKIRRGISVRAYLLLPELFDQIDFRDRIFPNAYATLWELANLKNQHTIFNAHYPRIPDVTASDSPPPFQRVFLLGPWLGDRRPFREPREAYPQFGEILRLTITKELRAAALSAEANASADGGAPLSSPTSRDLFCTVSALGIRLINYRELADLAIRQLLMELDPDTPHELLQLIAPLPERSPAQDIRDAVERGARGDDPNFTASPERLADAVERFFAYEIRPRRWLRRDLQSLHSRLRVLLGLDASIPSSRQPGLMDSIRDAARGAVLSRLRQEDLNVYRDSPRGLESFLQELSTMLDKELPVRPDLSTVENMEGIDRWISNDSASVPGTLAQQLTPPHLERLRDAVLEWLRKVVTDDHRQIWTRLAVISGARDAVATLLDAEQEKWRLLADLRKKASELLEPAAPFRDADEQTLLDGRRADAMRILEYELQRVPSERRQSFISSFLSFFTSAYENVRRIGAADELTIGQWIDRNRKLFADELSVVNRADDPDIRALRYELVSPEALFSDDELKLAILRCATRVFQPGRVQARASIRLARLLVPTGFRRYRQFHEKLRGLCRAMLGASSSSIQDGSDDREKKIVIVLEDLFHPAEDLSGIYDYYSQYASQPDQLLFHINRNWPPEFPPLITRAGNRGRVGCGNPDCDADIRTLDRTVLFCPQCARPIKNRCGNAGCLSDDLGSRWNHDRIVESRTCPACKRFLHTYWWSCADHGDVPMDKQSCPECVREEREPAMISVRPDRRLRFTCPRCVLSGILKPFTVTGELARYLKDGVNGHAQVDAELEIRSHLNPGGRCSECGTQLVPYCPETDPHAPNHPHFLYRNREKNLVDRFRCYLHVARNFYTCAQCEFPVELEEQRCRRCGTNLADCRFCTPGRHLRVGTDGDRNDPRCSHCGLPLVDGRRKTTLSEARPFDLFCSNVFGCPAGGRLTEAVFPRGTVRCPICDSRDLPLLLARTRRSHLEKCAYCTRLFGWQPEETAQPPYGDEDDTSGDCCLCGMAVGASADLVKANGDTKMLESFLAIGHALRCFTDDEDAFLHLLNGYAALVGDRFESRLLDLLGRVRRREVARVITGRINRLIDMYRAQFGCRTSRSDEPCDY